MAPDDSRRRRWRPPDGTRTKPGLPSSGTVSSTRAGAVDAASSSESSSPSGRSRRYSEGVVPGARLSRPPGGSSSCSGVSAVSVGEAS